VASLTQVLHANTIMPKEYFLNKIQWQNSPQLY